MRGGLDEGSNFCSVAERFAPGGVRRWEWRACSETKDGVVSICEEEGTAPRIPEGYPGNEFRRWGSWEDNFGNVNAWNDCGNGGTAPGEPGTLDCLDPGNTESATSTWDGIVCTDDSGQSSPQTC